MFSAWHNISPLNFYSTGIIKGNIRHKRDLSFKDTFHIADNAAGSHLWKLL